MRPNAALISRTGRAAFSLVELLVVVGIIAVLIGILLPALSKARRMARTTQCLSNMRNMQTAHWMYVNDNNGLIIQAGLAHGGVDAKEEVAWINTLQQYYGPQLIHRCPADESPHWPGGIPVPNSGGKQYRRTSYGINNFLDYELCPWGGPYKKINQIRQASATIQFVIMAETGDFAGADHPHIENWISNIPFQASKHLATGIHGGKPKSWDAISNYGFLDGHAETLRFRDAFENFTRNKFDPAVTQ